MHQSSQRFVLTGGIGSGKSFVSALLAGRGWVVIEADRIGHAVLEPDGSAFAQVARRWPDAVRNGRIDRKVLGRRVFASPAELAELESFTHPAIRATIAELVRAEPKVAVEIPILNDWLSGWPVVVVDAPDDVRRARLLERGLTQDEIASRFAAQPTRQQWLDAADWVLRNDGDEDLREQIEQLEQWLGA